MIDFQMPESACPHCGHTVNACGNAFGQETPKPGDLSVCINCAEIVKFGQGLTLLKLEEDEIFQIIQTDPEAYNMLQQGRQMVSDSQEYKEGQNQ